MEFRKYLSIAVFLFCGNASADIFTVVDVVETSTANVNVPTSMNGHLTFRPCADQCGEDYIAIRLTPETQFVVRGQAVSFDDFRRAHSAMRGGKADYALVSYDTEKRIVTSVRLGF